ncbi:hypothetical protein [Hoyosella altamirensis]|uniref:Uncharacterized protein n=1 Tax=Hoyosella altamirensis TaxID=616997 RepID=A0A839RIB8_9ACTN|nr:hypothetical protein [Hoyosella altamirensis]MBB3035978.1 hypothetical protein [Hoyosella altamirensis]
MIASSAACPATEYRVVEGVTPETRLAEIRDWGGKFAISDEQIRRNRIDYLSMQVEQTQNTIVKKINTAGLAAIDAALDEHDAPVIPATEAWDTAKTIGDPSTLTSNGSLPFADIVRAMAHHGPEKPFSTLLVNPQ